jgi:hypothetical protein
VVWVSVFEELADDGALVERFGVVLERWDQTARVESQERSGFVVGVYFDVLVGDFLFFEDGPGALDEGAAVGEVSVRVFLDRLKAPFHFWYGILNGTHNQPE